MAGVKVLEWAFRRLESGQRAMVVPVEYAVGVGESMTFVEVGYEGRGTDNPVLTGRELVLFVREVTQKQQGMAAGYVLLEFID